MSSQDLISQWDLYPMHGETPGEYGETPGEYGPPPAMAPVDPGGVPSYKRSQQVVSWALEEAKALRAEAIAEKAEGSALPQGEFCFHTATAKVARLLKRVDKLTVLYASIRTRVQHEAVRDGVCQTRRTTRVHLHLVQPRLPSETLTLCRTRCLAACVHLSTPAHLPCLADSG